MKDLKILVPLDDSPLSKQTVKGLIALKETITVPLTLLHIFNPNLVSYRGFAETPYREIEERARESARQFIADQQAIFAAAGMQVVTLVKEGHARETICALADSGEYDLLVIGRNKGSEMRNLLFGQVANFVVHQVKCPVLII
jgi:nucleotide-binding universal stress UspA family protein